LSIAIIFPHPLSGSLGSFRRVKEIALSVSAKMDVKVNIYTPYERENSVLTDMLIVKPVPRSMLVFGLSDIAYRLSKTLYYHPLFSRKLLIKSIDLSKFLLYEKLRDLLSQDEVAVIQAEHDVTVPLALKLGKELGVPVIADLHNISAEELVAAGILRSGDEFYVELQSYMRRWLSDVDFICVVSEEMKQYVKSEYNLSNSKILVVPPGGRLRRVRTPVNLRNNRVVFMGTISYREHVDLYVKSIPFIQKGAENVKFYATRRGEDLGRLKSLCKKLRIPMNWFWFPSEEDLYKFLCDCSVGVLPSSNDRARILGTPIKLLDYMSMGLPVVANHVDGWSRIIEEEEVGILTDDNPEDFGSAILELLHDEDLRAKMSYNALNAVKEKYNWDKTVEPLVKVYENFF